MQLRASRPVRAAISGITVATILAGVSLAAATAHAQDGTDALLGRGTALAYENCYEHVGGFLVPIAAIGADLPAGFAYQTVDAAGTIGVLTVVGLDCELAGTRVADVFINIGVIPPPGYSARLLRLRGYTSHPLAATRFAQWCFGDVVRLGQVLTEAVTTDHGRTGRVYGTDGTGSIELLTTTPGSAIEIPPAKIQHLAGKEDAVHGLLEFTADAAFRDRGTGTLILDHGTPIQGVIGQHIYPAPGHPFTFTYRGLTACPPGLDWND